jgi:hypothetical protein
MKNVAAWASVHTGVWSGGSEIVLRGHRGRMRSCKSLVLVSLCNVLHAAKWEHTYVPCSELITRSGVLFKVPPVSCSPKIIRLLWNTKSYCRLYKQPAIGSDPEPDKSYPLQFCPHMLGAFAKLREAAIRFVASVRPSACMEQLGSHWTDFHEIWYLSIFRKSVEQIQVSLKSDKNSG